MTPIRSYTAEMLSYDPLLSDSRFAQRNDDSWAIVFPSACYQDIHEILGYERSIDCPRISGLLSGLPPCYEQTSCTAACLLALGLARGACRASHFLVTELYIEVQSNE